MAKYHEPIANFNPLPYPKGDVMQFFFENPSLYANTASPKGHNGWDISREWGTPIFAVQDGKVVTAENNPLGNGEYIRILCSDGEWEYGHLSKIQVTLGQQVKAGDQIGLMGNTGFVVTGDTPYWKSNPHAGTHLHLSHYPCTPYTGTGSWNRSYPSDDKAVMTYFGNGYNDALDYCSEDFGVEWVFNKNLNFGMTNHDVFELQTRLGMSLVTGYFGLLTFTTVINYQRSNGITPTGFCGPLTRAQLNTA